MLGAAHGGKAVMCHRLYGSFTLCSSLFVIAL